MGSNITGFPNGVGQYVGFAIGGAAGNHTVVGGLAVGDRILKAVAVGIETNGTPLSIVDLSSEFAGYCSTANTASNASGTDTTNKLLFITFADNNAGA